MVSLGQILWHELAGTIRLEWLICCHSKFLLPSSIQIHLFNHHCIITSTGQRAGADNISSLLLWCVSFVAFRLMVSDTLAYDVPSSLSSTN